MLEVLEDYRIFREHYRHLVYYYVGIYSSFEDGRRRLSHVFGYGRQ